MIKRIDAKFKSHIKSLPLQQVSQVSKGRKSLAEIPFEVVKDL